LGSVADHVALLPLLHNRSEKSVEFKHQNISAVPKGLGEDWIPGYKPAFNFQMTLVDAVARWLRRRENRRLSVHPEPAGAPMSKNRDTHVKPVLRKASCGGSRHACARHVGP